MLSLRRIFIIGALVVGLVSVGTSTPGWAKSVGGGGGSIPSPDFGPTSGRTSNGYSQIGLAANVTIAWRSILAVIADSVIKYFYGGGAGAGSAKTIYEVAVTTVEIVETSAAKFSQIPGRVELAVDLWGSAIVTTERDLREIVAWACSGSFCGDPAFTVKVGEAVKNELISRDLYKVN